MTSQRRLVLLVGGIVLGALALLAFYKLFYAPYRDLNAELDTANLAYEKAKLDIEIFNRDRKGLDRYRLLGLPANLNKAVEQYTTFLEDLIVESGYKEKDRDIQPPADAGSIKAAGPAQSGKKAVAGHVVKTWTVHMPTDWRKLVTFLDKFRQVPFLHRIKTLNIEKSNSTKTGDAPLNVTMTIEAMVVNDPEKRPSLAHKGAKGIEYDPLRPDNLWGVDRRLVQRDVMIGATPAPVGWSMILRAQGLLPPEKPEGRDYGELARRDPFKGGPPDPVPDENPKTVDPGPGPGPGPQTKPLTDRQMKEQVLYLGYLEAGPPGKVKVGAWLRNKLVDVESDKAYIPLSVTPPKNTFTILTEKRDKTLVQATVLKIEQRDVYFQVGDAVYGIHAGGNLAEAMDHRLTIPEIDALELRKMILPLDKEDKPGKLDTRVSGMR